MEHDCDTAIELRTLVMGMIKSLHKSGALDIDGYIKQLEKVTNLLRSHRPGAAALLETDLQALRSRFQPRTTA